MNKLENLKKILKQYDSAVIAFSGGVDSTFLAKVANEALDGKVLLVTASSSTYPLVELEESKLLAKQMNIKQKIFLSEEVNISGFVDNSPDRCYYCKNELFAEIQRIAKHKNYDIVFDGSNFDDLDDFRPGRRALKELGVVSPLCEAKLTKKEIRDYSSQLNLPTANKPAYACLASRFPYGETINKEKLNRVGVAEQKIRDIGFSQFRVRSHETMARLEFIPEEMEQAWQKRDELYEICKNAGYIFVAIDTKGYRMGAMNEELGIKSF